MFFRLLFLNCHSLNHLNTGTSLNPDHSILSPSVIEDAHYSSVCDEDAYRPDDCPRVWHCSPAYCLALDGPSNHNQSWAKIILGRKGPNCTLAEKR